MPDSSLFFYKQPRSGHKRVLFLCRDRECIGKPCFAPGKVEISTEWKSHYKVKSPRAVDRMADMKVCETWWKNDFECPAHTFDFSLMEERFKEGWQSTVI